MTETRLPEGTGITRLPEVLRQNESCILDFPNITNNTEFVSFIFKKADATLSQSMFLNISRKTKDGDKECEQRQLEVEVQWKLTVVSEGDCSEDS